jgi:hypothetical protein
MNEDKLPGTEDVSDKNRALQAENKGTGLGKQNKGKGLGKNADKGLGPKNP